MQDLTKATATELYQLYASGSVTPVTVAQQLLDRIARLNPQLNAFCFTEADTTMAQAQASADRWRQGQPLSKIDGIPVSVKDSILVKGWPTLQGSLSIDPTQAWDSSDAEIDTLCQNGVVLLGKTAVPEFNSRDDTYSALSGVSRNPWNLVYSPGGSSGGSAAAVSARLGPISVASDQYGSVILPSAFCGVVGYKPTGHTVIGYMANSVSDIELVTGFHSDSTDFSRLTIGYLRDTNDNEILPYTDDSVTKITSHGLQVEKVALDIDLQGIFQMVKNHIGVKLTKIYENLSTEQKKLYSGTRPSNQLITSHQDIVSKTQEFFSHTAASINAALKSFDIVLTSATTVTACRAHKLPPDFYARKKFAQYNHYRSNAFVWNITGQPTVTIPTGLAHNGLPVGLQIVGKVGQDVKVLEFARYLQTMVVWPNVPNQQ